MEYPKAAIIILTKSKVKMLLDCLSSIKAICTYPNYTIYIADTGSSLEEKKEIYEKIPDKYRTKFIELPSYHFGKNNNLIVYKYIAEDPDIKLLMFMNNDVMWVNDCLTLMTESHQRIPDVGTVGARLLFPNNMIQHAGMLIKSYDDFTIRPGHIGFNDHNLPMYERTYPVVGNTAALILMAKDLFLQIKGFPIHYTECMEDVELNLRCLVAGKQNYYVGHALAYHLESATRKSSSNIAQRTFNDLTERLIPYAKRHWKAISNQFIPSTYIIKKEDWSIEKSKLIYSEYMETDDIVFTPDFNNKKLMAKQTNFESRYDLSSLDKKLHIAMIGYNNGCGYVRLELPAKYLNSVSDIVAFPTQRLTPELVAWAHIFVWQAPVMEDTLALIRTIKEQTGKPQILENDDNLLVMPFGVKTRMYVDSEAVKNMLKETDYLTVTMDSLGRYYKDKLPEVTPDYRVLPNCIDFISFPETTYTPSEKVFRIGWMGGASHYEDLKILVSTLKELKKNYKEHLEIHIIGWDGRLEVGSTWIDTLDNLERFQTPFRTLPEYFRTIASSKLDLVFIPLADTDFNKYGKSPLKFIEASASKLPCVVSNSPVFSFVKHKETGYIVETPKQWTDAIIEMLENKDLRCGISENAYKYARENFNIVKHVSEWAEFYRQVAGKVFGYKVEKV